MLTQISNFLDDSTGIEKTLRLAQGIFTVLAGLSATAAAAPWSLAKAQVNLGRRYLRLHKWHPCFRAAYRSSARTDVGALEKMLEVAKWSFLGLYFLMEMPTITNAMGITTYAWATQLQHEALKCWFYGISFSIVLGWYQVLTLSAPTTTAKTDEKTKDEKSKTSTAAELTKAAGDQEKQEEYQRARVKTRAQLAIDHCDIFLPGSAVGWIPVGPVMVGTCQSISSLLAMGQVWEKVVRTG